MATAPGSADRGENFGYILGIILVATLGGFLFGFDSGVINGTVDGMRAAFGAGDLITSANVASMLIGGAIGALAAGRMADLFGRRTLMLVSAVFFIVSAWGSGIATSSPEFIVYRLLGGLAVGAASVLAPAYIAEVSPAAARGRLASVQQVAIIIGLFGAFISNYTLAAVAGGALSPFWFGIETWRWMFWMELPPAALFLAALLLIPESPRYLVLARREERAERVLARLFGDTAAKTKLAEIRDTLKEQTAGAAALIDPKTKRVRRIVWIGLWLAVFQQVTGINVVFYYGAVLWQSVGFSEADALLVNVSIGAVSVAAVALAMALIDRVGRKPLLEVGGVVMALSLGVMAAAFAAAQPGPDGAPTLPPGWGIAALIGANVYVFAFNATWGPVLWTKLGEMFPNRLRGLGIAIGGATVWLANFLVTVTFLPLLAAFGLAPAYAIFAAFAAISVVYVQRMVRETKGVELEQMEG